MEKYLHTLTNEDFKIFEEIEALRSAIISQDRIIEVVDYGAGSPEENRTKEEMQRGCSKTISTKELCKIGLKNDFAHLIYALVKQTQPSSILELGTCCGFSSIYMAKALQNPHTILHTIEGSKQTAMIAQENFHHANTPNIISHIGRFSDLLPSLLPKIAPLDFVFIDGHHDKEATLEYFEMIKPHLNNRAIVLFDDISWSQGMKEAWESIKKDTDVTSHEDFHKIGLCILNKGER